MRRLSNRLPNFIKKNEKWGIYIVCFLMYNYLKVINKDFTL